MPAYVSGHASFAEIACENFKKAVDYKQQLDPLYSQLADLTGLEAEEFQVDKIFPLRKSLGSSCLIAIVFAALAVEGYIYYYAVKNLPKGFVESHLDKLDLVSKWILIPRLVTGKEFPKDSEAFRLLKQLVSSRNYLVHIKASSVLSFDEQSSDFVLSKAAQRMLEFGEKLFEKAEDAIKALDHLSQVIENLDPNEYASADLMASSCGRWKVHLDKYGM